MKRLIEVYMVALKAVMGLLLAGMVILVFGNVVLRYAFDSGISISAELSRWFFVWMVFLGGIVGIKEHKHLGIDSLVRSLSAGGKKSLFLISHTLMIGCSALLLVGSFKQTVINLDVAAPATGLSTGLFYSTGVVFSVSAIIILGYEIVLVITGRASEEDLIGVVESEDH